MGAKCVEYCACACAWGLRDTSPTKGDRHRHTRKTRRTVVSWNRTNKNVECHWVRNNKVKNNMKLKHMNYSYRIEENCIRKKYRIQLITLTYLNPYGNRFSIIPKACHVYCLIRHIECIHIHILFVPSPTSHFTYCQHNNINQLCNFCSHHMFRDKSPRILAGKATRKAHSQTSHKPTEH